MEAAEMLALLKERGIEGELAEFAIKLARHLGDLRTSVHAFRTYPMEEATMRLLAGVVKDSRHKLPEMMSEAQRASANRALDFLEELFEERGWCWETMEERRYV